MSLENGQKTGLEQLVRQFQEQQYNADLQPPTMSKPTELDTTKTTQLTDLELNELVRQLRKLRLSTEELARMAVLMLCLDRIR